MGGPLAFHMWRPAGVISPSHQSSASKEFRGLLLSRVNKMPTFELIFPRNFLEVNYSSLKFDEKTDNFPRKSEIFQLSMIFLG